MSKEQDAKREALAKAVDKAYWSGPYEPNCWLKVADFILARSAEREGPLVEALNYCRPYTEKAGEAIRAWQALDAPPPRTLAEVAADVAALRERFVLEADRVRPLLDELADALERANASDKPKASAREKGAK